MKSAAVTGSAGFIGSTLVETLLAEGWSVRGIDSFLPSYEVEPRRALSSRMMQRPGYTFFEGDLTVDDLGDLVDGVDVVFHLAARPGVRASWDEFGPYIAANLEGTKRLLDAVVRSRVGRFVFSSSSSVYGQAATFPTREETVPQPMSPYGVSKAAAEQLVRAYESQFELDACILRYFTVFGPRQRSDMAFHKWIKAILSGQEIVMYGDGTTVRDFTYVEDVVGATMSAVTLPAGTTCNVAGGSPAALQEVIGVLEELAGTVKVRYEDMQRGDPRQTGGDTSLLRELTGWKPEWSLRQGLERQLDSIRLITISGG